MIPGAHELFGLDTSIAHLNHGSFGAVPIVVREARHRLTRDYDANPHRLITGDLLERTAAARCALADFVGAQPDLSALVENTTQGIAMVLNSLNLIRDDEVIVTDHSYRAVTLAVDDYVARRGIRVIVAPVELGSAATETVASVTARVTDRAKLVIVDQISSATAQLHPVAGIAAALRGTGVPLLVDAAHGPGMQHLAAAGIDADFWVGNLHKWAFAAPGTALIQVAPTWRDRMMPLAISHHRPDGFPMDLEDRGTVDFTTWLAAPAGLSLFDRFGEHRIQQHNAELAAYGQRVIGAALGLAPDELPDPGPGVSMRIIPLPSGIATDYPAATALRARIASELKIEVAISPWRHRGLLRVSAQIYNTEAEYDRLATHLPGLLARLAKPAVIRQESDAAGAG